MFANGTTSNAALLTMVLWKTWDKLAVIAIEWKGQKADVVTTGK